MSALCYCDYETGPSFFKDETRHAAKEHQCSECPGLIHVGEKYIYSFGIWDGFGQSFYWCKHCVAVKDWVTAHLPCFCFSYGGLHDDVGALLQEISFQASQHKRKPNETTEEAKLLVDTGFLFGTLRRQTMCGSDRWKPMPSYKQRWWERNQERVQANG